MFKVAALYKFYNTKNPIFIHKHIKSELSKFSVKGTIIIGEEGIISNKEVQSAKTYGVFNAVHNYIIPLCCNTYLDVEPSPVSVWLEA